MTSLLFPQVFFSPASGGCSSGRRSSWHPYSGPSRCGGQAARPRHDAATTLLWNLFDDSLGELERASSSNSAEKRGSHPRRGKTFSPRFDVKETREAYLLEGELPGIEQSDVSIEFVDEATLKINSVAESHHNEANAAAATEKQPEAAAAPLISTQTEEEEQQRTATPASESGSTRTLQPTVEDTNEWVDVAEKAPSAATQKEPEPTQQEEQPREEPAPQQQQQPQSWLSERRYGEFSRVFRFSERVDRDAVTASLRNGLLQITVPKAAAPEVRRIVIE